MEEFWPQVKVIDKSDEGVGVVALQERLQKGAGYGIEDIFRQK